MELVAVWMVKHPVSPQILDTTNFPESDELSSGALVSRVLLFICRTKNMLLCINIQVINMRLNAFWHLTCIKYLHTEKSVKWVTKSLKHLDIAITFIELSWVFEKTYFFFECGASLVIFGIICNAVWNSLLGRRGVQYRSSEISCASTSLYSLEFV